MLRINTESSSVELIVENINWKNQFGGMSTVLK